MRVFDGFRYQWLLFIPAYTKYVLAEHAHCWACILPVAGCHLLCTAILEKHFQCKEQPHCLVTSFQIQTTQRWSILRTKKFAPKWFWYIGWCQSLRSWPQNSLSTWQQAKLIHLKERFGIPQMTCKCTTLFRWSLPAGFLDGPHQHKWLPPRSNRMKMVLPGGLCLSKRSSHHFHCRLLQCSSKHWYAECGFLRHLTKLLVKTWSGDHIVPSTDFLSASLSSLLQQNVISFQDTPCCRRGHFFQLSSIFETSPYMASEEVEIRKL